MFNAYQDTAKRKRKEESREGAIKIINRNSADQFNDINKIEEKMRSEIIHHETPWYWLRYDHTVAEVSC